MSAWPSSTYMDGAHIELSRWSAFSLFLPVLGRPTVHVVGLNLRSGRARVSSPVAKVHVSGTRLITSSGRHYDLLGPPGPDSDRAQMLHTWMTNWDATVLADVTETLVSMPCQLSWDAEIHVPTSLH